MKLIRSSYILDKYILSEFFSVLFLCVLASTGLFLVFDTFERIKVFISYSTPLGTALFYLLLKIPLILQLMLPIATLIAVLISIGRLSQKSEITAMRACGMSVLRIYSPIFKSTIILSLIMFLNGELLVPKATERVEEIFQFEIKQKHLTGKLDRTNFWIREGNSFLNIDFYNTKEKTINGVTLLNFSDQFELLRRVDAKKGEWHDSSYIGWNLESAIEIAPEEEGDKKLNISAFTRIPLESSKTPQDLYNLQRPADSFGYFELKKYIKKLKLESVPTRKYEVDLMSKISFPFVCIVAGMLALPFSLASSRSGALTKSFIYGVSIGFSYYITHALLCSFAGAGMIPVILGAWAGNVIIGSLGLYLLGGAEFQ